MPSSLKDATLLYGCNLVIIIFTNCDDTNAIHESCDITDACQLGPCDADNNPCQNDGVFWSIRW